MVKSNTKIKIIEFYINQKVCVTKMRKYYLQHKQFLNLLPQNPVEELQNIVSPWFFLHSAKIVKINFQVLYLKVNKSSK